MRSGFVRKSFGRKREAEWDATFRAYFQDFDSMSRDYFAPMNEFNQKLQATFRKSTGPNYFNAGLTLGHSHSSNFGDIFSAALSGTASRTIAQRWKLFVEGFKSLTGILPTMVLFHIRPAHAAELPS